MILIQMINAIGSLHDGTISSIKRTTESLILTVHIQYLAEMIDSEFNYFTYEFINVHDFYFESWKDSKREEDTSKITALELEITDATQEGEFINIVCFCDDPLVIGGNIYIKANDLIIYDESNKQVTFEEITKITNDYWNGLEGSTSV